ncbi:hypothetical protein FALBO_4862 [Fusarium albosuccineum]|uniref:Uncharacterized protein n=1 Tax=Fusarium albosuccineum TaxID=1237068 RepID=A0A8H4PES4_9HYPO|nr:hypothetical protein FALBO_4862 [Fusarium albosuccineum]
MNANDIGKVTSADGCVFICLASAFSGEVPRDVAHKIKGVLGNESHLNDPRDFIQTMKVVWPLLSEMSFEDALEDSEATSKSSRAPANGRRVAHEIDVEHSKTAPQNPICREPRGAASFVYSKSPGKCRESR